MIRKYLETLSDRYGLKSYFNFGEKKKSEWNGKADSYEKTLLRDEYSDSDEDGIDVTDKRISFWSFIISLSILIILTIRQTTTFLYLVSANLGQFASDIADLLLTSNWLIQLSILVAVGLLISALTYFIVFMDSYVPGVIPPSPVSPRSSRRVKPGPRFHLNYVFAVALGPIVAACMYVKNYYL